MKYHEVTNNKDRLTKSQLYWTYELKGFFGKSKTDIIQVKNFERKQL